jgi:UPF0042 nucleotide-binding protein
MEMLVIAGVSGSGKSVALAALEDSGYYTVNNLPPALLVDLARYLAQAEHDRVAVTIDVKTSSGFSRLAETIAALRAQGWGVRFLYLEAKTDTLMKRFAETRRRHPFTNGERTLQEAIGYEREMLIPMSTLGYRFDTTELPPHALREWIREFVATDASRLTLQFQSFGFKHGVPLDSDLVFDVRCLPNPYYDAELAPMDGREPRVCAFLDQYPEVERMYTDIYSFVAGWLPDYARDARAYLTVSIGCTGGRHRSVYLVERLARVFAGRYQVLIRHRELH